MSSSLSINTTVCAIQEHRAVEFIRKMRGGCQAHLLEVDNGRRYVVKFSNNPQGRRTLVNEWLGHRIAGYLRLRTPDAALIRCTRPFLDLNPDVDIQYVNFHGRPCLGPHFGSLYPDTPKEVAIYDIFPSRLMQDVVNLGDFAGMLAVDKWLGNADARQAIFHAAPDADRRSESASENSAGRRYVVEMIDFGQIFNGERWDFVDSPLLGFYRDPAVYAEVDYQRHVEPWIDKVRQFPEDELLRIAAEIPDSWIGKDRSAFEHLLGRLLRRRARIGDLMQDHVRPRAFLAQAKLDCAVTPLAVRKSVCSSATSSAESSILRAERAAG